MKKYQKGFTLIELLIVIGIIAVLIGVFVTTVNLSRPFEQARDAQRYSNVSAIASAVKARMADNRGVWTSGGTTGCPALTAGTEYMIVASTSAWVAAGSPTKCGSSDNCADLDACLKPKYMSSIPVDPDLTGSAKAAATFPAGQTADNGLTGYTVKISAAREVTVTAPLFEAADSLISVQN